MLETARIASTGRVHSDRPLGARFIVVSGLHDSIPQDPYVHVPTGRNRVEPSAVLQSPEGRSARSSSSPATPLASSANGAIGTPPDEWAYPTRRGFDTFFGYLHQIDAHTYYPGMLWDNEREFYIEANFSGGNKKYSHDLIAERALKFIDDLQDEPFFLYAPFTPPHGRFEVPSQAPYEKESWDEVARIIAAMITRLDSTIGEMLDRLTRKSPGD